MKSSSIWPFLFEYGRQICENRFSLGIHVIHWKLCLDTSLTSKGRQSLNIINISGWVACNHSFNRVVIKVSNEIPWFYFFDYIQRSKGDSSGSLAYQHHWYSCIYRTLTCGCWGKSPAFSNIMILNFDVSCWTQMTSILSLMRPLGGLKFHAITQYFIQISRNRALKLFTFRLHKNRYKTIKESKDQRSIESCIRRIATVYKREKKKSCFCDDTT